MENFNCEHNTTITTKEIEVMYDAVRSSVERLIPGSYWKITPTGVVVTAQGEAPVSVSDAGAVEVNSAFIDSSTYLLLEMSLRKQFALMAIGFSFRGSSYIRIVERAFGYVESSEMLFQKEFLKKRIEDHKRSARKKSCSTFSDQNGKGNLTICYMAAQ